MAYLFGDSTPFPLDENYIETMHDSIKVSAALLASDEAIENIRATMRREQQSAEENAAEMKKMASDLARSVEPYKDGVTNFISGLSVQAAQTIRSLMDRAHHDLAGRRDQRLQQLQTEIASARSSAAAALEQFLLTHMIADTAWSIVWSAGMGESVAKAQAVASTPMGLEATFDLDLSSSDIWSRPVKVSDLRPEVVIQLPKTGGLFGRGKLRPEELERYYLTQARLTQKTCTLVVLKALKPSAPGFEVSMMGGEAAKARVKPTDGGPEDAVEVVEEDVATLFELWKVIKARLVPQTVSRVRMVTATVDKTAMDDLDKPGKLAERVIKSIAPHVQEIVARSPVRGELALKREVKDGRREELFISVRPLMELYAPLGEKRRALFDVLDLQPGAGGGLERVRPVTGPVQPIAIEREALEVEMEVEAAPAPEVEAQITVEAEDKRPSRSVKVDEDALSDEDMDALSVDEVSGMEVLPSDDLEQMVIQSEDGEVEDGGFEEEATPLFNIDMLKKMQGDD
jgi:hypothetical protein